MKPLLDWANAKYGKEKVREQILKILSDTQKENEQTTKVSAALESTLKRLTGHISNNNNIEYINLGGQLIEYRLQRLIRALEFETNSQLILADFDTSLKVSVKPDGKTLGMMVEEFRRLSSEDKLVSKLQDFNGKRRAATHKIYEEFQDVEKVNNDLKEYVSKSPIQEIVTALNDTHTASVSRLVNKLVNDFGVKLSEDNTTWNFPKE